MHDDRMRSQWLSREHERLTTPTSLQCRSSRYYSSGGWRLIRGILWSTSHWHCSIAHLCDSLRLASATAWFENHVGV